VLGGGAADGFIAQDIALADDHGFVPRTWMVRANCRIERLGAAP
jgi:hypothetical protein